MQNFIDNASNIPVINGAIIIKTNYLPNGYLIDPINPMTTDAVDAVEHHLKSGAAHVPLSVDQVSTYLAASSLLHTLDGWVYLSHAIESLLKGDNGISIHLAYYAELRSSMSFLATEGVGIFNFQHLNMNSVNVMHKAPGNKGTHSIVWEAVDNWVLSTVKPVNSDILKVFSVDGKTFEDWVNAFPFPSILAGTTIIKQWMRDWNFDVNFFKDDKTMRNEVSYRPKRLINTPPKYSINELITELSSYWDILEPNQSNRFELLDKYLLKILLKKMYDNLSPTVRSTNTFEDVIIETINRLGLTQNQSFIDFLKDTTTHRLFTEAKNNAIDPASKSLNALSVIARATLMLRISTGYTSLTYSKAGVTKPELNFLWENYGVENGFWDPGFAPTDFTDLWEDIKDHVEDVTDWALSKSPNLSLSQIYEDGSIPLAFNYFKQFNRAGLWGMSI